LRAAAKQCPQSGCFAIQDNKNSQFDFNWIATAHIREPRDEEVLEESRDDKSKKLTLSLESAFSYFYRFAVVSFAPCWHPLSSFLAVATFR